MRKFVFTLIVALVLGTALSACVKLFSPSDPAEPTDAAWIALNIENGKPAGTLNLIAGQEYVFQRITLAVDDRGAKDSRDALDWLRQRSSFRALNWDGVRESRAHWRNYRESRPDADLYSHVFEGAK